MRIWLATAWTCRSTTSPSVMPGSSGADRRNGLHLKITKRLVDESHIRGLTRSFRPAGTTKPSRAREGRGRRLERAMRVIRLRPARPVQRTHTTQQAGRSCFLQWPLQQTRFSCSIVPDCFRRVPLTECCSSLSSKGVNLIYGYMGETYYYTEEMWWQELSFNAAVPSSGDDNGPALAHPGPSSVPVLPRYPHHQISEQQNTDSNTCHTWDSK